MRRSQRVMIVGAVSFLGGTVERVRQDWRGAVWFFGAAIVLLGIGAYLALREDE